jgi:hypothetical protein
MQRCPKKRYAKSATKEALIRNFGVGEGKKNCRIFGLIAIDAPMEIASKSAAAYRQAGIPPFAKREQ